LDESWDSIVIGAGPSGLFSAALLAARGQRVLVLEAGSRIGGRRGSGAVDGAPVEDGAFALSRTGGWEDVYTEIGKPVPTGRNFGRAEYFRAGEWHPLLESQDRGELRKVLAEIEAMSYADAASFDDVPLDQWLGERTDNQRIVDLFFVQMTGALIANTPDQISAGESINMLKQTLDRNGSLGKFFIVVDGSSPSLYGPLLDAIVEAGGEVRLNTPVQDVIVEDGRAVGVEIDTGPRIAETHVRDTVRMMADDVICTVPPWSLFNVVAASYFPPEYVTAVTELSAKVSHVAGVTYGVSEPAWDYELMRWYLPAMPKLGVVLGAYFEGPSMLQFYTQLHWYEHPYLLDQRSAENRRKTRAFLRDFEDEVLELFPEVVPTIRWRMPNIAPFSIAQAPGLVGDVRPSWITPIPHLYLVGNQVREARGIGHDAAAHVAIACANHLAPRTASVEVGAR
jgi:protoporphyrinogen oxidase